jgi:hypothetical protein
VHLLLDDVSLATDSLLATDSVVLTLPSGYRVSSGQSVRLALRADLRADAALGNYLIRFADSTFMEVADFNSAAPVYAFLAGGNYPVWSAELSVAVCDLGESFTNFPNPFNPARGELTTIGFNLAQDAQVDIEVFSITGRSVKHITRSEFRAAGSHQDAVWAGQNDSGIDVQPGTYFCVITARYTSGETQTARRKIAVVR